MFAIIVVAACVAPNSDALDDRRRTHSVADAERDQGADLPLRSNSTKAVPRIIAQLALREWPLRAAVDVDARGMEIERPAETQHHGGEGLLELE